MLVLLPKKMAICQQYRKCGKTPCRCNTGALHGPYFFHFFRVDGRLAKRYIRKADAKKAWERYSREREIQKQRVADRQEFREEFRQLSRDLRHLNEMLAELTTSRTLQQGLR